MAAPVTRLNPNFGTGARVRQPEDLALRERLEAHHQEALGWALSLCRYDIEEAENAVQSAYVSILSRHAAFEGRSSFRTWLFAVVRTTAVDLRRREWLRRLRLIREEPGEREIDRGPRPDERVDDDQRSRRLRALLAKLPRRQHEVLQLVFYHDLSIAEAARVMAVSLGSARRHYERGKQRLRERFAEEPFA
jgi:RNA polymerase sigma-70 factor (ECF subfamily)